jgi:hypothetical protein
VQQLNHSVVRAIEVAFNSIALPAGPGLNMPVKTGTGSASEDALRVLASWAVTGTTAQRDRASERT